MEKALHLELNGTSNLDILVCTKTVICVSAVIASKWLQSRSHDLFLSGSQLETQPIVSACTQNCF
jgi:hypothetical protein